MAVVGALLRPKGYFPMEKGRRVLCFRGRPLCAVCGALRGELRQGSRHCEGQAAIRAFHITSGLPDPFAQLPRVAFVVAGLKKRYGTKERRRPVTPEMLRWLYTHLRGGTLDQAEAALQWGALCLAFFFLLLDTGYHSPLRGLRGKDLRLTRGGKPCSLRDFEEADELTVFIRGSKTDVYNRGEYRNHYKTGLLLCPVKAAAQLFRAFPLRFAGGPEEEELLFRDTEGKPLPRTLVSTLIRKAAEALGEPEGALGTPQPTLRRGFSPLGSFWRRRPRQAVGALDV